MSKKNKRKSNVNSGVGSPVPAATSDPPPPLVPKCTPVTATAPENVPSISGTVLEASSSKVSFAVCDAAVTQSPTKLSTVAFRIETGASALPAAVVVSVASKDMNEERSKPTTSSMVVTKSDSDIFDASGTSCEPGVCGKKKRDPLNSSYSSDDDLGIHDRLQLGGSRSKCLESPVKKMKCSGAEYHDLRQSLSHAKLVTGESTLKYKVPTPDGDYWFYGPRKEFSVVNLNTSRVLIDLVPIDLGTLPPKYRMLLQHPEESFFVTGYRSNFPNRDESAYRNRQMRHLFYLYEEKKRICDSDTDDLEPLPDDIEFGMKGTLATAVDKIRDSLIYRTRAEQDNVFNREFYCTRHEDGYKPPFSNTKIYQQKSASESMFRLAILLLALADSAMDNIRMVAGIGYCYIARRVITEFYLLSLLEQPYKVLDHVIRQKVSAAVYALELYTKKDARVVEKPFNDVCKCFTEITFTLVTMTKGRIKWDALKSFEDRYIPEPEFLAFTDEMINPYTHWTIDEHLAWTTDVTTAIRTARKMSIILENIQACTKTLKKDLTNLMKLHSTLVDFEIDPDDYENKHLEALVLSFQRFSIAPLLECIEKHEDADEFATKVADDLTIAIEAERRSEKPNPVFFKQMLEGQMFFTLLRLFYHMWEVHRPKDVTKIRLKLLGIRQAAAELRCNRSGDNVSYSALIALSGIMYMDYTCGMVSKASVISIKKARKRCHDLAKEHLDSNERCKETCLSFLNFKMEEIQRSIVIGNKTEDSIFERCCRILKIASLAYPVLSYFHSIPKIHHGSYPFAEKPADESYARKSRKYRSPHNGQKLLYLFVPYEIDRNVIRTEFLSLEEETYADAVRRKKMRVAAADHDYALQSDNDEDDEEEDVAKTSSEEQGNASPFLRNLSPAAHREARGSSLTTKSFPKVPTREMMADALVRYTRPSEAVGVILEPLRSLSPTTDEDSGSRPESNTPTSDSSGSKSGKPSRNETVERMKKFKPIDLLSFYKDITNGNQGYPLNPFAFGSSTIEELFAKPLILDSHGNAEEKFKNSLANVLKLMIICINKILARSLQECDVHSRQKWKKWHKRVVHLTNQLEKCRIMSRHGKELIELMYNWSVVLGFPKRIFVNPDSC